MLADLVIEGLMTSSLDLASGLRREELLKLPTVLTKKSPFSTKNSRAIVSEVCRLTYVLFLLGSNV
jgi:hypothetical protein